VIELLKGFPDNVAALACHGHVTKADYETVLIPDINERLTRHKKLRVYYEIAPDFVGVDPGAVWDDTKLGLSHFLSGERLAVVTDVDWIKHSVKFFGFLMPAQLRTFPTTEADTARKWIVQPQE
jgi:SpoIIAA-like